MKTILVVDDEPDIQLILTTYLKAQGYATLSATDGLEAVALAQAHRPDLIVLDLMMPEMNGYQVARMLKSDAATQAIPLMMLTAKSQPSDRFWGLESGAEAYMVKPFDLPELVATIRRLTGEAG